MPIFSGIGALIGAIGSFVTGLGAFGQALIGIGLKLGASALSKLFVKKPQSGAQLERQAGEESDAFIAFGDVAVAGHLTREWTTGQNNRDLIHVVTVSRFPASALIGVIINGKYETMGASAGAIGRPVTSGDFANRIWIKFIDGSQTVADSYLTSVANPAGIWTATDIGRGCAAMVVTMRYDRDRLTSVPKVVPRIEGAKLYDWRKDSTVGGSGTHRWNDQATWEFTKNPIVMAYNYHRGLTVNGVLIGGMEIAASDLPLAKWTAAANVCDEMVGSRRRYEAALLVNLNAEHGDNVDAMMQACGGTMVNGVGETWPLLAVSQPVVATITDADIIVSDTLTFTARQPFSELINSVSGTYPEPQDAFEKVSYQRATSTAALTADRRTRDVQINYDTVTNAEQAAQLAVIKFNENRFQKRAEMTLRPRWQCLEPGDWAEWQSDVAIRSGIYMVTGAEITSNEDESGPRNMRVSLQQRDASIYAGVGTITPATPVTPDEPVRQNELASFTATAVTIAGGATTAFQQPGIKCQWDTPLDPTIIGVVLEHRVNGTTDADITTTAVNSGAVSAVLSEGVVWNTTYQVRSRIVTDPPRAITPTAWTTVATGAVPAVDVADLVNGAATGDYNLDGSLGSSSTTTERTVAEVTVDFIREGVNCKALLDINATSSWNWNNDTSAGSRTGTMRLRRDDFDASGTILRSAQFSNSSDSSGNATVAINEFILDYTKSRLDGTVRYYLTVQRSGSKSNTNQSASSDSPIMVFRS